MALLALIAFIALYFLHGIREQARRGAEVGEWIARELNGIGVELERMNDARVKELGRARHDAAHGKGRQL